MWHSCAVSVQVQQWTWTLGYAWRTTNALLHLDVIALLLTSVYALIILCRGCWVYYATVINSGNDAGRHWTDLYSRLGWGLEHVKSIAAVTPALGVAGTCFAVFCAFRGGNADSIVRYDLLQMATALVPTALGLAIGVVAQFVEWFLRSRIEATNLRTLRWLGTAPSLPRPHLSIIESMLKRRGRFALQVRFSQLPAFPIFAAPSLILLVAWFIPFHVATGFHVRLTKLTASTSTSINIAVTEPTHPGAGNVYVNGKQIRVETLHDVLVREQTNSSRTTYVSAENNVRWAEVANVIDAAKFAHKDVVLLTTAPDISSRRAHRTLPER